jgi:hypothetical protein
MPRAALWRCCRHGASRPGAARGLLHAGIDREDIDQAGDTQDPADLLLRGGQSHVATGFPGPLQHAHQHSQAAGVCQLPGSGATCISYSSGPDGMRPQPVRERLDLPGPGQGGPGCRPRPVPRPRPGRGVVPCCARGGRPRRGPRPGGRRGRAVQISAREPAMPGPTTAPAIGPAPTVGRTPTADR